MKLTLNSWCDCPNDGILNIKMILDSESRFNNNINNLDATNVNYEYQCLKGIPHGDYWCKGNNDLADK